MPYSNSPATSATDRVRLTVGDVFADFEILDDNTYQYLIDKNKKNERLAAVDAAKVLKFQIAQYPHRETAGEMEEWNQFAQLYTKALDAVISGTDGSINAIPLAGGTSREELRQSHYNRDRVGLGLPHLSRCPYRHYVWNRDELFDM
jgi:hypothetical protein